MKLMMGSTQVGGQCAAAALVSDRQWRRWAGRRAQVANRPGGLRWRHQVGGAPPHSWSPAPPPGAACIQTPKSKQRRCVGNNTVIVFIMGSGSSIWPVDQKKDGQRMPVISEGDDDKGSRSKNDLVRSCDRKLLSSGCRQQARDPATFSQRPNCETTQEAEEAAVCRSLPQSLYSPI